MTFSAPKTQRTDKQLATAAAAAAAAAKAAEKIDMKKRPVSCSHLHTARSPDLMPVAGAAGAVATPTTSSARGGGGGGTIDASPASDANPDASPVAPTAAATGAGGSAAAERTIEVMRADWQML